ncbi:tetratricopeptide repeat protein [Bacillus clarus]|uniref:Tetratricopeptide repeat family protein n=1 Tax=Bacillus clarus TaxID=2338372 RepID=A0A090YSD5_9BACI|nr:hypothetical protein [Bacillus clarus]KFN01345.1 tetratricopeptide repeat family protein [Bacillus clarus]RFT62171.1 tetratricopeptide repeat protein [Bacillus clarus]
MKLNINENEKIISLLNLWYEEIIKYNLCRAKKLKDEVNTKLKEINVDSQVQIYYDLFDFRYQVLTDGISINKKSFEHMNSLELPADNRVQYYYYFFKAICKTMISEYKEAETCFEKAEELLVNIQDEIEKAEFQYRKATFYYQTFKPLEAIEYSKQAKYLYSNHTGYEVNATLCENTIGLACIDLRQFEKAEEYLNTAIDTLQKQEEESLLLRVRYNLAWLYNSQKLSSLAIRHASEITEKIPNHYKAIFVQAKGYYKLGDLERATRYIRKGLDLAINTGNEEYRHHFTILNVLCKEGNLDELEKVTNDGISYFEKEEIWDCVKKYTELLAIEFYKKDVHSKASHYFYMNNKADGKQLAKGALK